MQAINAEYARDMGYQFRWYTFQASSVMSPRGKKRAPAWAKLLAINQTLFGESDQEIERADVLLYLDSDAYINMPDIKIGTLKAFAIYCSFNKHSVVHFWLQTSLTLWADDKGDHKGNTGVMLWRRDANAFRMLQSWWELASAGTLISSCLIN